MTVRQKLAIVQAATIAVFGLFLGVRWLIHQHNDALWSTRYTAAAQRLCDHPPVVGNNPSNPFASTSFTYKLAPACYDTYLPEQSLNVGLYTPGDYISNRQLAVLRAEAGESTSMRLDLEASGIIVAVIFVVTGIIQLAFPSRPGIPT